MTKKTAFGVTGIAAATLIVAGFAGPAMADDSSSFDSASSSTSTTATSISDLFRTGDVSNSSPLVLAPSIGNGDVATGDILSGNALLSGNDVSAPVASGNEVPVLSGNDTSVSDIGTVSDVANPVVNDVANPTVEGGDVTGGDIGTNVDDLVDGGDIGANVDNLVGGILTDLGIED